MTLNIFLQELKDSTNKVYQQAVSDYNPDVVAIDLDMVSKCELNVSEASNVAMNIPEQLKLDPGLYAPFFIVMTALNYKFWDISKEDGSLIRYTHEGKVGALAMQDGFSKMWMAHMGAKSSYTSQDSLDCINAIKKNITSLQSLSVYFGDIPNAQDRLDIIESFDGQELMQISAYLHDTARERFLLTTKDAQLLAEVFPKGYADVYLKKAQLCLMFFANQWNSTQKYASLNLDLTAAADYQLPKVLRGCEILKYCPELANLVDGRKLIESGSKYERAIRAATVIACYCLAKLKNTKIENVDFALWLLRNLFKNAEFQLTDTSNY